MRSEENPRTDAFFYDKDENLSCILNRLVRQVGSVPIFVANGFGLDLALASRLRRQGTRIIYVVHGNSSYYYDSARHFNPIVDAFVAVSSVIGKELAKTSGGITKVLQIPNGVGIPETSEKRVAGGPLRLVYVGGVDNKLKGLDRSPDILAKLKGIGIPFVWTIIGDGPYLPDLKQCINSLGLSGCVHFLGQQTHEEVLSCLGNQDVLLLFSRSEGMNMAMLEGMARGVIPVVADTPGVTDVLSDGQNGFVVPQDSLGDMTRRIHSLWSNPRDREVMSHRAWETVHNRFSIQSTGDSYESLFQWVDSLKPWSGSCPDLVCRRGPLDLPFVPNRMALAMRRIGRRCFRNASAT